jgi:hypothetical protein
MGVLLGVPGTLGATVALILLLLGTVMDSLEDCGASLRGVVSVAPSLVVGRPPFDIAEAGLNGGGIEFSALKKLDRRLPFAPAGDGGTCERLSIVRSESEGRTFLILGFVSSTSRSFSGIYICSGSASRKPACESARDEALEAERKPSKSPSTSSSLFILEALVGWETVLVWRDDGRPMGFLNVGAFEVEVDVRACPLAGTARLVDEVALKGARFEFVFAVEAVKGVLVRASDARDVFFCSKVEGWLVRDIDESEGFFCSDEGGWLVRDMDDSEGFFRSGSAAEVEAGGRN